LYLLGVIRRLQTRPIPHQLVYDLLQVYLTGSKENAPYGEPKKENEMAKKPKKPTKPKVPKVPNLPGPKLPFVRKPVK
jgi:hypothetical protein